MNLWNILDFFFRKTDDRNAEWEIALSWTDVMARLWLAAVYSADKSSSWIWATAPPGVINHFSLPPYFSLSPSTECTCLKTNITLLLCVWFIIPNICNTSAVFLTQCCFFPPSVCVSVCMCLCVCVCVLIKVLYQVQLLMCVFISWMCGFIGELDLSWCLTFVYRT